MDTVRVNNEVGRLKRVLVHRPGPETRRFPHGEFALAFPLRPTSSDFDLARAQDEHDALTAILRAEGAEVVELTELVGETLGLRAWRPKTSCSSASWPTAASRAPS